MPPAEQPDPTPGLLQFQPEENEMPSDQENDLVQKINDAQRYRSNYSGLNEWRKTVLVSDRRSVKKDRGAFRRAYGATEDFVVLTDGPDGNPGAELCDISTLRFHPQHEVVVASPRERQRSRILAQHGVRDIRFLADPQYKRLLYDPDILRTYAPEFARVHDLLCDQESKLTLASALKYRMTGDHGYLRIASYAEYAHPAVQALPGDVVFDLGAANGDTAASFARAVGPGGKVLAFEPEPRNISTIESKIEDERLGDVVQLVPKGIGGSVKRVRFSGAGGSGRVEEKGETEVEITTIDEFCADMNFKGDVIFSFDIEGAEEEALVGGLESFRRHRPLLQISIYHKPESLFYIPLWVASNLADYDFYMGHHDSYMCETDLYCVPKEKSSRMRSDNLQA